MDGIVRRAMAGGLIAQLDAVPQQRPLDKMNQSRAVTFDGVTPSLGSCLGPFQLASLCWKPSRGHGM